MSSLLCPLLVYWLLFCSHLYCCLCCHLCWNICCRLCFTLYCIFFDISAVISVEMFVVSVSSFVVTCVLSLFFTPNNCVSYIYKHVYIVLSKIVIVIKDLLTTSFFKSLSLCKIPKNAEGFYILKCNAAIQY